MGKCLSANTWDRPTAHDIIKATSTEETSALNNIINGATTPYLEENATIEESSEIEHLKSIISQEKAEKKELQAKIDSLENYFTINAPSNNKGWIALSIILSICAVNYNLLIYWTHDYWWWILLLFTILSVLNIWAYNKKYNSFKYLALGIPCWIVEISLILVVLINI